jgi:CBS domain-containing protein
MKQRNVGVLPVVDGNKPIGVITDRDITLRAVASGADVSTTRVSEVMTRDVQAVHEDQTISDACALMEENRIRRLVVLNQEGELTGVLTLNDVTVKAKDTRRSAQVLRKIAAA